MLATKRKWLVVSLVAFAALVVCIVAVLIPRKSSVSIRVFGQPCRFTNSSRILCEWRLAITNTGDVKLSCYPRIKAKIQADEVRFYRPYAMNSWNAIIPLRPGEGFESSLFSDSVSGKAYRVIVRYTRAPGAVGQKLQSLSAFLPILGRLVPNPKPEFATSEWFEVTAKMLQDMTNSPGVSSPVSQYPSAK